MKKARLNLDNTSPTANQLASSNDAFLRLRTLPQDQNSASPVQKIYNDLVEKVTFASRNYKYDYNFAPGIQFFKFLTNYPEIKKVFKKFEVWIPDTFVFNDSDNPDLWLYTNQTGFVQHITAFNDYDIATKLCSENDRELCAVLKRPQRNSKLNEIRGMKTTIMNSIDIKNQIKNKTHSGPFVMQKYIKTKGPLAFVCKSIYRKSKQHSVWVVSNKSTFHDESKHQDLRCITNVTLKNSCTIQKFKSGRYVDETVPYIANIIKILESKLSLEFEEFACDFIKDENQVWWLVSIKAFLIVEKIIKNPKSDPKSFTVERTQTCRICQIPYHPLKMNHNLTVKMITETDLLLRKIAFKIYEDDVLIGESSCDLFSFHSQVVITKQYFDIILGKNTEIGFLKCSVGFDEGGSYDIPIGNIRKQDDLYIPPEGFCFAAPFLDEWMDIFPDVGKHNAEMAEKHGIIVKQFENTKKFAYILPPRLSVRQNHGYFDIKQSPKSKRSSTPKAKSSSSKWIIKKMKQIQPLIDRSEKSLRSLSLRSSMTYTGSMTPTLSTTSNSFINLSRSSTPIFKFPNTLFSRHI